MKQREQPASQKQPKWYLLAIAVAIVLLLAVLLWPRGDGEVEEVQTGPVPVARPPAVQTQDELRQALQEARQTQRQDPEERLLETIDSHRARVEADPESEEAPGYLNAMGNLYLQRLGDLESAAEVYQRIIMEYPDWPGTYAVYPQLEVCYQELGDGIGLRWVYERMMQRFPPESEEYAYAREQLGLTPPS
jgi:tetratricopeptide (TPR) repeat protein